MRRLLSILLAVCLIMSAVMAWAFWSAGSWTGGNGAAAVTSVNQGATPTASAVAQAVTVSWAASTLTSGQAVTGYQVKRYDANTLAPQTILSSCTGTVAATTCVENSVPPGSWKYAITPVFAANWLGAESARSTTVTVAPPDSTSPTNTISLSTITGGSYQSGNSIYYRGAAAGSFTLTNAVSDSGSGPASSATATLGGTTTGWSHTPSTVSTPSGGPYVSNTFSWAAGTTSGPTEVVTGRDVAGNTAQTTLTFVNDSTAPTSGTISYTADYQPGLSVPITLGTSADSGSGIATRWLQRQSAPLSAGTCLPWTGFANVGAVNPASVYTDTAVSNGTCYRYRYVVTDNVGNTQTTTTTNVSMVDFVGAVKATPGVYSYWRLGEALASSAMVDDILAIRSPDTVATRNNGAYGTSPTMGVAGAIAGDPNTAVQFDGQWPAYATAARQLGGDFSFEFWFKSTQDFSNGSDCTNWWQGAGLIDADYWGPANDFGISLCSGKVIAGVGGTPDVSIVTSGTYNNGAWHQVVFTRTQSSGAMALYVDGVVAGTATGSVNDLNAQPTLHFGQSARGDNYFAGTLDEVILYNTALAGTTIAGHYQLGTSVSADVTGPTGGSVDASGLVGAGTRYSTSTTLSLVLAKGTDPSGVATTGNQLLRASASLTNGTCGTFGSYTLVSGGTDPVSPKSDTVSDQFCYSYQYVVLDTLANSTTYTSPAIKVDLTPPAASSTVKAQYKNLDVTLPTDNSIKPGLQLVNNTGSSAVDLSTITVRYWFTKDTGASTFQAPCYWASIDCSNINSSVVAVSPRTGADAYLLVGFKPYTLAAGPSSVEIQLGINKTDWSAFNEVDDYSYGTGTSYIDWTKVTVYQGGTLIWGTEP
jgi:Cellulose binding domain/Concanavalin A-like lectin/glucanases superfamily